MILWALLAAANDASRLREFTTNTRAARVFERMSHSQYRARFNTWRLALSQQLNEVRL